AHTGLEVEVALADSAYGSGQNRARFEQAGIQLLAKVPRPAQSKYFNKREFEIDLESMTCRCPAGNVTSRLKRSGSEPTATGQRVQTYAFSFPSQVCAACPLRARCYTEKDKSH